MKCIDCKYFEQSWGVQFCQKSKRPKRIIHGDELKDVPCIKVETIDEIIIKYYPQYIKYIKRKENMEQNIGNYCPNCGAEMEESEVLE